jgi:hypothetical protein
VAIFRLEAKIISRNGGHSSTVGAAAYQTGKCATSAAAYRAGDEMTDERTGQKFDYSKKLGVLGSEIILPPNAPEWMGDRSRLWNAVEAIEKRRDSQLARDFIVSLPHELTDPQRRALLKEFVGKHLTDRGYVADVAFHAPPRHDNLNWHAHVMVPTRKVEGDGFTRKKERPEGNPKAAWRDELAMFREDWAAHVNRHLEAAGIAARVDHRSNEAQGIDREPQPKLGPIAAKIEGEGRVSHAGDDLRAVHARNADRARLKVELAGVTAEIIDLQLERTRRVDTQQNETDPALHAKQREAVLERVRIMEAQANQPSNEARLREELTSQAQKQADDAHRHEREIKRQQDAAAANGDITDPSLRYAQALGSNHVTRNAYDLLANAALTEYGMFAKKQQELKDAAFKEKDPAQKQIIELQAKIEGTDYMWITSRRLGGMSDAIAGRDKSEQGEKDREAAHMWKERGDELRQQRAALIEQQREEVRANFREGRENQAREAEANRAADRFQSRDRNFNSRTHAARQQQDEQPDKPAPSRDSGQEQAAQTRDRQATERKQETTPRDASADKGSDRTANTGTGNEGNSGNTGTGQGRASGSGGGRGR